MRSLVSRRSSRRFAPWADGSPRIHALEARALAAPGMLRTSSPYLLDPEMLASASQASSQGLTSLVASDSLSAVYPGAPPVPLMATASSHAPVPSAPELDGNGAGSYFYSTAGATLVEATVTGNGTLLGAEAQANYAGENGLGVTVVQNPPFAPPLTYTNYATFCNATVGDLPYPGSTSTLYLGANVTEHQSVSGLNMTGAGVPGGSITIATYAGTNGGATRLYELADNGTTSMTATVSEDLNISYTPPTVAGPMGPPVTGVSMVGSFVGFTSPNLTVAWMPGTMPVVTIAKGATITSNVQQPDLINIDIATTLAVPPVGPGPSGVAFPVGYSVILDSAIMAPQNLTSSSTSNMESVTFNYDAAITSDA